MNISPELLEQISNSLLGKIESASSEEAEKLLHMSDYHGFLKSKIPAYFLDDILAPFRLTTNDVQIEIVKVDKDLSKEVHFHDTSYAYCVILGPKYQAEAPVQASAYRNGEWQSVQEGDIVSVPPQTLHGFTVKTGGNLVFLSVQAPPIEHEGVDDYHKVEV